MSIQLKLQVLAITPAEKRTFDGRASWSRQFQCFLEGKVAVHSLYAPDGDKPEEVKAREVLNEYQSGFYMADLEVRQGARGKLEFGVTKIAPVVQGQKPAATA